MPGIVDQHCFLQLYPRGQAQAYRNQYPSFWHTFHTSTLSSAISTVINSYVRLLQAEPLHALHDPQRVRQDDPLKVQPCLWQNIGASNQTQHGPSAQPSRPQDHWLQGDNTNLVKERIFSNQRISQPSSCSSCQGFLSAPSLWFLCRDGDTH